MNLKRTDHSILIRTDALEYGCLYNLSIGILPTDNSEIIEVIDDKACARYTPFQTHLNIDPI